jgi:hypothetical protein
MATLEKLAERCEKATGPDRELDAQIGRYFSADFLGYVPDDPQYGCAEFTRSLDAAMTLVPEGWPRSVSDNAGILGLHGHASVTANPGGNIRKFTADAATPALALSAAALKARSQLHGGDDGDAQKGSANV